MANVQDSTLCSEKTGSQAVSKLLRDVAHEPTATTAIRPHTPWKNKGHLQAFGMRNSGCRVNGCPEMDQKKKDKHEHVTGGSKVYYKSKVQEEASSGILPLLRGGTEVGTDSLKHQSEV